MSKTSDAMVDHENVILAGSPAGQKGSESILTEFPELEDIELPKELRSEGLAGDLDRDFPIDK